jgi:hypothetical protein
MDSERGSLSVCQSTGTRHGLKGLQTVEGMNDREVN